MNPERKVVDIAPDLVTGALEYNLINYLRALLRTPVGKEYPLPKTGKIVDQDAVEISEGSKTKVVRIADPQTEMEIGKKVIIYKQGIYDSE